MPFNCWNGVVCQSADGARKFSALFEQSKRVHAREDPQRKPIGYSVGSLVGTPPAVMMSETMMRPTIAKILMSENLNADPVHQPTLEKSERKQTHQNSASPK